MSTFILIIVIAVGLFIIFYSKTNGKSDEQKKVLETVKPIIQRNQEIINESIEIAKKTKNYKTAKSRIELAENKYKELEQIKDKYPFLNIGNLHDLKSQINSKSYKILNRWYDKLSQFNQNGIDLEKKGEIDKAIKEYEKALKAETDTPRTYKRLAILYRKQKDIKNEIRVLNKAIERVNDEWYINRLNKIKQ